MPQRELCHGPAADQVHLAQLLEAARGLPQLLFPEQGMQEVAGIGDADQGDVPGVRMLAMRSRASVSPVCR